MRPSSGGGSQQNRTGTGFWSPHAVRKERPSSTFTANRASVRRTLFDVHILPALSRDPGLNQAGQRIRMPRIAISAIHSSACQRRLSLSRRACAASRLAMSSRSCERLALVRDSIACISARMSVPPEGATSALRGKVQKQMMRPRMAPRAPGPSGPALLQHRPVRGREAGLVRHGPENAAKASSTSCKDEGPQSYDLDVRVASASSSSRSASRSVQRSAGSRAVQPSSLRNSRSASGSIAWSVGCIAPGKNNPKTVSDEFSCWHCYRIGVVCGRGQHPGAPGQLLHRRSALRRSRPPAECFVR